MTGPWCDQLDDYLCGWLPPDEAAAYEAHLADCAACREECALQRRIDRQLAEGTVSIASIPAGLKSQVEGRILAARRRRTLGWAAAVTTTTAIAIAFGIWATRNSAFSPHERGQTAQSRSTAGDDPPSVVPLAVTAPPVVAAHVRMVDPSSAIVVPLESRHPDVTIVRIFPTIRTDREDRTPAVP